CYPTYDIDVAENQIELVERGNIWRYCNIEPLTGGIWEEARAMMLLGRFKKVLSPNSVSGSWSTGDLIKGLRSLQIHGINHCGLRLFGYEQKGAYVVVARPLDEEIEKLRVFDAVRLDDERIGTMAAKATLENILNGNTKGNRRLI
ncbi:MAG: hypothetical protein AABZ32_09840, partial [Bacteroidota bacterium]